jgi:hypothetical protein
MTLFRIFVLLIVVTCNKGFCLIIQLFHYFIIFFKNLNFVIWKCYKLERVVEG